MKSIYMGLLLFVMIIVLAIIGGTAFGFLGGLLGLVAGLLIVFFAKKPTVYFLVGQRQYVKGNHEKAYSWMKRAYNTTKLAPKLSLTYAYMLIRDGNLTEAEALINKITYLNKRDLSKTDILDANINKALILWKKGELSSAIELLENMYDDGLKSTVLYGTLGYFYILSGELSKAMEFNTEGYEYNSDNMIIEDNLGLCCILNRDFEKAEEIYQKIFAQKPEFIEPFFNYGMLLERKGMYKEAKEYYKKALKYPEKFLSTISHKDIRSAIENLGMSPAEKAQETKEVKEEMAEETAIIEEIVCETPHVAEQTPLEAENAPQNETEENV